eukprot:gene5770-9591_t
MSVEEITKQLSVLANGIPDELPSPQKRDESVPHAPNRVHGLSKDEQKLAIKNALRYFPSKFHEVLAPEFYQELQDYGHIYMYRFRPTNFNMKAYPINCYPAKTKHAAAIMVMITNNLDPVVAQFPHELVTYGGNGSVFNNWGQFLVTMKYLSELGENQTLDLYSGHPLGLFPSNSYSPRVVITNGLVVPNYSTRSDYDKMYALGNTIYGQMTAGSFCYIGPQGIVHGTTLTVLNAGRKYLSLEDLQGKVFVTSGLGGMSGAQGKAGLICKCVTVIAEVDKNALNKRYKQGWITEVCDDLDKLIELIKQYRKEKKICSIGYHGNVVDLWEKLANQDELLVELGSDQTSCHNPFNGGYYPVQCSFEESNKLMVEDPSKFKKYVQETLKRHVDALNVLTKKGMRFWDYGNSFLLEAGRAGADIFDEKQISGFKYPSYVQDIMGDIFSLGFGPFRWVCTSGDPDDLALTDKIAAEVIQQVTKTATEKAKFQYNDNLLWIQEAGKNKLVVGSQARILYSDSIGRTQIALAFNEAVNSGKLKGPVVLSRDHHDVGGADSPFRETANIYDGSQKTGDMSVHTFVGNAMRGATWIALHNGGGTGWGEALNCGFGFVLDGTKEAAEKVQNMLFWDVNNGVARRNWSGNDNAEETIELTMKQNPLLKVTMANKSDEKLLEKMFK